MITKEQYDEIQARLTVLNAWVDTKRSKNGWASFRPEEREAAGIPDVTNDERSLAEEYDWITNPPDKYSLYVDEKAADGRAKATTWTGTILGNVSFGQSYRDNFGGRRIPINVYGTNGREYHGTYFVSSGNYVRIKAKKVGKA